MHPGNSAIETTNSIGKDPQHRHSTPPMYTGSTAKPGLVGLVQPETYSPLSSHLQTTRVSTDENSNLSILAQILKPCKNLLKTFTKNNNKYSNRNHQGTTSICNLQPTGKNFISTGKQQFTGKKLDLLYIKGASYEYKKVIHKQQPRQQVQYRDKSGHGNTGNT